MAHTDTDAAVTRVTGYRVVDLATGTVRRYTDPPHEGVSWLYLVSAHELVFETTTDTGTRALYIVDPTTLPIVPAASSDAGVSDGGPTDAGTDSG